MLVHMIIVVFAVTAALVAGFYFVVAVALFEARQKKVRLLHSEVCRTRNLPQARVFRDRAG